MTALTLTFRHLRAAMDLDCLLSASRGTRCLQDAPADAPRHCTAAPLSLPVLFLLFFFLVTLPPVTSLTTDKKRPRPVTGSRRHSRFRGRRRLLACHYESRLVIRATGVAVHSTGAKGCTRCTLSLSFFRVLLLPSCPLSRDATTTNRPRRGLGGD